MYTDLIKIEYPSEAYAGDTVEILVYIKNQYSSILSVKPRAIINGITEVVFTVEYSNIPAGYTYYFTGYFTMPNADATIRAESYYYGADGLWHFEDYQTRTVNLTTVELKRLIINRDPIAGGYVTTTVVPETGTVYDGYYPKGTTLYVVARPNVGYTFKGWSGELTDTPNLSAPVYMTENRTITAHFEEEVEPSVETLEVDITPVGAGYVTTVPASEEGKTTWYNDETGTFPYGTQVRVTAHPSTGYIFEKWSDEIVGGVSYQNPEYVQTMTEHRAVKAHFREEEEPPVPGEGELTAIVVHWQEYTDLVPPAAIEKRGTYEIHPVAKNIGSEVIQFRIVATVTKPSGEEVVISDIDGWPHTSPGSEFKPTLNMGSVDEVGTWTAIINLYDHKTDALLDSRSGELLIVSEAPLGVVDMFSIIGPLLVLGIMTALIPKGEGG